MKDKKEGHNTLIRSLERLLQEARNYEFHDFKNTKYATPKMALVNHLELLIARVKRGDYDD